MFCRILFERWKGDNNVSFEHVEYWMLAREDVLFCYVLLCFVLFAISVGGVCVDPRLCVFPYSIVT